MHFTHVESEFLFFVRSESDFISNSSNKLPELTSYFLKIFLVVFSAMFTSRNSFKNKWVHFYNFELWQFVCICLGYILWENITTLKKQPFGANDRWNSGGTSSLIRNDNIIKDLNLVKKIRFRNRRLTKIYFPRDVRI